MNGGEWHSINRYDDKKSRDENIACVGFDPRTGVGLSDAKLIAAAPDLYEALSRITPEFVALLANATGRGDCVEYSDNDKAIIDACNAALSKALGETP
jgi:hypothetical protein